MKELMGILNVNNESFFAGSRCTDAKMAVERMEMMYEQGADIIDLGGCSTRPGSIPVSREQEWEYLKPVLSAIPCNRPYKISIDTFYSRTVELAYDTIGEFIVNDISAGEDDSDMLPVVGRLKLPYIAMHKRGTPSTMQQMCNYPNGVVNEVIRYFREFEERAAECGITDYMIDPGLGFAKTIEQNYELLCSTGRIKRELGRKMLIGLSRKGMIWKLLGTNPNEALCGTVALNLLALVRGADIIRVHDVKEGAETVKLAHAVIEADKFCGSLHI